MVTGLGGMGRAVAERLGPGRTVVVADINPEALADAAAALRQGGYDVVKHVVDVSDPAGVVALADTAAGLGKVEVVVHTAGLSPVQASVEAILKVDLVGTALVLDAFESVMAAGGAGVFIASMAGTMAAGALDTDLERRLATTPASSLLDLPELARDRVPDPGTAYGLTKRANQIRVQTAAVPWGRRGARVNSISPGIISTPMSAAELDGPSGDFMRQMVAGSPTGRLGTAQDIAAAVEFLASPGASFITGTDLLVDGGVVASLVAGS